MKILVYMYKSNLQTLILKHQTNLHNLNHFAPSPIIRSYTTKSIVRIIPTDVDSSEFKISFLKNKCGLSGKRLIYASNCLNFDSSDQRPDSVLELFRSFGFTQPNITRIISCNPLILLHTYHPETIIKPKLDFLFSICRSQADVVAIVTKNPFILFRSLTNHLIPSLNLLNSVTGSYANTVYVLKHNPFILNQNVPESFLLNTRFLLTLGVPHSQILKLLRSFGPVLGKPHDRFCNMALKLKDMGFDLSSSYFVGAIYILCFLTDSSWKSRCVLFRSFGFSDQDIISMFKKLPQIMGINEKTMTEKMEFFLNKLHWTPRRLVSHPIVLCFSLKKRTIPRCSVMQVLVSKHSTSESCNLPTILNMTDKKFVENFVTAHKDEVPEVLNAYEGKLSFHEYTFRQKGT